MEKVLRFFEKYFISKSLYRLGQPIYHFLMAFFAVLIYGFPSKKMIVIGVTGTKGKSTTCYLIAQILEAAGFKTGMATTVLFKIGEKEWINDSKQTMLGRFQLQKLLKEMVNAGCLYAVIETSSEGILQYRHRFIDYDIVVFTNLSPEHIERHGSFENYQSAKIRLFEKVAQKSDGVGVYNLDDENVKFFLEPKISQQHLYALKFKKMTGGIQNLYKITDIKSKKRGTSFLFNNEKFGMSLIGEFNIYNAAGAICVALSQGISMEKIKTALSQVKAPPGRFEVVDKGQDFTVIIDYAHEPASLEAVYKAAGKLKTSAIGGSAKGGKNSKLICLLGGQGGGRDKWKRPKMGEIALKYCDKIILTNEDPYDENPLQIINDIESGLLKIKNIYKIINRKEAIRRALSLAKKGDIVILTGKGGEVWMCVKNEKKIPWDERKIVEEILNENKKRGDLE
ncbi:MAG: UDP-N-acetylmuramoyl-L-alanyl-D-glutamate--2,6-diaminopimelate ligase [Patescibacteria group bacterium]|mgnify:CR=1 FL=1